jgi:type 2A phosphatase activator TIP41
MSFGNNSLTLSYDPSTSYSSTSALSPSASNSAGESSTSLRFQTLEALGGVAVGEGWEERIGGGVKVSMAESWGKSRLVSTHYPETSRTRPRGLYVHGGFRSNPSALLSDIPLPSKPVKPHDWTYSTIYAGSVAGPSVSTYCSPYFVIQLDVYASFPVQNPC